MPSEAQILRRIERLESRKRSQYRAFNLTSILFERQLPFGLETARNVTAVCTRRSGKSYACAAKLIATALAKPGCIALYVTLSRLNAKRLVWGIVKHLVEIHSLDAKVSESDLSIHLRNSSWIYLAGAKDESEVDKFRGLALGVVILDEAQAFPSFIGRLVDEVLAPALMDFAGQLFLVGTPGPVPVGYFYDCTRATAGWAHHAWSVVDNPWIARKSGKSPHVLLAEELERRGVTADDPSIQREWFGRWVLDTNALVFRFDPALNGRSTSRQLQHYVIGVDMGFDDSDAIAVLGWRDDSPEIDLVHEWVGAKQTVTGLMERVRKAYETYCPLAVVADTGGLGKKIAEEITARTSIPIEAAEKERKLEHIALLNDAMRTKRFFAPHTSRFADDCMRVEWDRKNPEKPKISDRFHSDVADAVLYAWRRALAWTFVEPKAPTPKIGTPEWMEIQRAAEAKQLEEDMEREIEANRRAKRELAEVDQEMWA